MSKHFMYGTSLGEIEQLMMLTPNFSPRGGVLFLFTADETLWNASKQAVFLYGFDFSNIHLRQISTEGYSLYQMAKTIWIGKEYIRINEIADIDLINDTAFKAIINASLIRRYGANLF